MSYQHHHDTVHWHMADITARIIAESGIPSDRFHMGKIILQSLKDSPNLLAQIDGSTGQSETNSSVLKRSIQCAIGLKKLGFRTGDFMILMAPNHLDLVVPFYAALYLGIIVAPIDRFLGINELADNFAVNEPKIVFCQSEKFQDVVEASKKMKQEIKIFTFDEGNGESDFSALLKLGEQDVEGFCPTDFDPDETIAMAISTSGTTGLPKCCAATHKNFAIVGPYIWMRSVEVPSFQRALVVAPLQWLSAIVMFICAPYQKFTRIQSPLDITQEHAYEMINTYKPSFLVISPTMMATLMKPEDRDRCDFTCFIRIMIGGSAVHSNLIKEIKKATPKTDVVTAYGMTELTSMSFLHGFSSPPHSCGKPIGCLQYRLVDPKTEKDIDAPNVNGELWIKGPGLFKGYYNNPEATAETLAEGGWFKTGDMFYRDESWNFYFVERMKLLLKYRNHQISPVELEAVIIRHPNVLDVAVTGVPHPEFGDLPVACVVPTPHNAPTAQEIKDLVRDSLTDTKHLRGGVIFLSEIPVTATTKIDRQKLRNMVFSMQRE